MIVLKEGPPINYGFIQQSDKLSSDLTMIIKIIEMGNKIRNDLNLNIEYKIAQINCLEYTTYKNGRKEHALIQSPLSVGGKKRKTRCIG